MKKIGPNFSNELLAAGLVGLPFSWGADGSMEYSPAITAGQRAEIEAVLAAHNLETEPVKPATIEKRLAELEALRAALVDKAVVTAEEIEAKKPVKP